MSFYLFSSAPPRLCATTALNGALPKSSASQPFITPLGASLFLHLPRRHPVQSPFASLRANLRFTPDSFHSLPLRRGSEASLHCRALSDLGLPAPYYFYTFNFPTPATLVPPHYSLCSFFLEQSHDCLHLCNFPLRLSPYAAHLSPVPLAPFSRRVAPPDQWR